MRLVPDHHHRGVTFGAGLDLLSHVILGAMLAASCSARPVMADDVTIELTLTPAPPLVGRLASAALTVRDRTRQPVRGATLHVAALMSHPGMAPMVATAWERADGVYDVQLEFSMAGDWILQVTGTLPDGRLLNKQLDIARVRPAG